MSLTSQSLLEPVRNDRAGLKRERGLKPMVKVTFTQAKVVKGEVRNFFKEKFFAKISTAEDYAASLRTKSNVTDIRVIW